jgi:hypothetical protein
VTCCIAVMPPYNNNGDGDCNDDDDDYDNKCRNNDG